MCLLLLLPLLLLLLLSFCVLTFLSPHLPPPPPSPPVDVSRCTDFFRFFSLGEKLGQGATGKVFKATLKCPPEGQEPTTYAVKRVRRWGLREKAKKALRQEVWGF